MNLLVKIFLLISTIFSITIDGYLRESELSFCMDDCSQYYIYQEGSGEEDYVVFSNNFSQIDLYLNRYVSVTGDNEVFCVECSALEVEHISISSDCSMPVDCFVDPCSVSLPCEINTEVECISNYCGGCNADFYDSNNNLVDCDTTYCNDLAEVDFGECDMFLGVGLYNEECQYISGCGWLVDGVDYSDMLFDNMEDCENICLNNLLSCQEIENNYEQLHYGEFSQCHYDNDCEIVWGACDVGLGGCYYAVNREDYLDEEVNFLVNLWVNNDCMQWVCDCMSMPYPVCNSNVCEIANCNSPNPAGCIQTGCSEGYECIQNSDNCSASSCSCEDIGSFYGSWYCTEDCNGGECLPIQSSGDVNTDGLVNVLDVVAIINMILNLGDYNSLADINQDEIINVLDIILVIDIILNN
jgi:hypothetical protein